MKDNRERRTNFAHGKGPLRLLALCDGLFAIVLTLLVLDLRIPEALNADDGNMMVFLR
ncbi:MAG: TMEM175 family protein [Caldisericia bacterium]